jgi:hypothetical protein
MSSCFYTQSWYNKVTPNMPVMGSVCEQNNESYLCLWISGSKNNFVKCDEVPFSFTWKSSNLGENIFSWTRRRVAYHCINRRKRCNTHTDSFSDYIRSFQTKHNLAKNRKLNLARVSQQREALGSSHAPKLSFIAYHDQGSGEARWSPIEHTRSKDAIVSKLFHSLASTELLARLH